MINLKLDLEDIKGMSLARDFKAANYKIINKETGEIQVEYKHAYKGTLDFYFETGMEGLSSNLHDDRGWRESPSWNNETQKKDGPVTKSKSLEWLVFMEGGEYLIVFDKDDNIIWEGILFKDIDAMKEKKYRHHFLPKDISYEDWFKWCDEEYRAEILTNVPVLAEW